MTESAEQASGQNEPTKTREQFQIYFARLFFLILSVVAWRQPVEEHNGHPL